MCVLYGYKQGKAVRKDAGLSGHRVRRDQGRASTLTDGWERQQLSSTALKTQQRLRHCLGASTQGDI